MVLAIIITLLHSSTVSADSSFPLLKTVAPGAHVLKVQSNGAVIAWGSNSFGQLGDGTKIDRLVPITVPGLTDVVAVAVGGQTSYALKGDGTVWSWGSNLSGALGANMSDTSFSTGVSLVPVRVTGLSSIISISANNSNLVALKSDGTVWICGYNNSGQIADGTYSSTIYQISPRQVAITDVAAIAMGQQTVMALKTDGTVWTWGSVLGTIKTAPYNMSTLSGVVEVASGPSSNFALTSTGSLYAWGESTNGGNGDGTKVARKVPAVILTGVSHVTVANSTGVALKTDGTVWTWGPNGLGLLGIGSSDITTATGFSLVPIKIPSLSGINRIYGSGTVGAIMASDSTGVMYSWGSNSNGQLLNGTSSGNKTIPVAIKGKLKAITISSGQGGSMVSTDGIVYRWGVNNPTGLFGNGSATSYDYPTQASVLTGVIDVQTSDTYSLALKSDGTVWAWGGNYNGQLGSLVGDQLVPAQIPGLSGIVKIENMNGRNWATKADGTVLFWGSKYAGIYGDGSTSTSTVTIPEVVPALPQFVSIARGSTHSVGLKADGTLWAWGLNVYGELGTGSAAGSLVPTKVSNLTGVKSVFAGYMTTFAVRSDGTVWGFGANSKGQIGNGVNTVPGTGAGRVPFLVTGMSNIVAVSSGSSYTLMVDSDGFVWSSGSNSDGQLGYPGADTYVFKKIPSIHDITKISANGQYYSSVAMQSDGTVWTWGRNNGDGAVMSNSPVPIGTVDSTAVSLSLSLVPSTLNVTARNVIVNVNAASPISVINKKKWADGTQNAAYFATNGTDFNGSDFAAEASGTYSVYASDYLGNSKVDTITLNNIDKAPATLSATTAAIDTTEKVIKGITPGQFVSTLATDLSVTDGIVELFKADGVTQLTSGKVGTGSIVKVTKTSTGTVSYFTVVLYGDVNGDGSINLLDSILIKRHVLGTSLLTNAFLIAANTKKGSTLITASDLIYMKRELLGTAPIVQY